MGEVYRCETYDVIELRIKLFKLTIYLYIYLSISGNIIYICDLKGSHIQHDNIHYQVNMRLKQIMITNLIKQLIKLVDELVTHIIFHC